MARCGGVPTDIRFVHGLLGNILRRPVTMQLDDLSDAGCPDVTLRTRRVVDGVELTFTGFLANRQRIQSNVAFRTTYRYTPYWIRRKICLELTGYFRARRLDALSVVLDGRFTHWSAAHDTHTRRGVRSESWAPTTTRPTVNYRMKAARSSRTAARLAG